MYNCYQQSSSWKAVTARRSRRLRAYPASWSHDAPATGRWTPVGPTSAGWTSEDAAPQPAPRATGAVSSRAETEETGRDRPRACTLTGSTSSSRLNIAMPFWITKKSVEGDEKVKKKSQAGHGSIYSPAPPMLVQVFF
ncbi:hypothetical protein FRC12_022046 [Ceratobasidium sp. 428]|nr:hypothetical protein FRC12_022046 [Ceratobasidium sp. 428]